MFITQGSIKSDLIWPFACVQHTMYAGSPTIINHPSFSSSIIIINHYHQSSIIIHTLAQFIESLNPVCEGVHLNNEVCVCVCVCVCVFICLRRLGFVAAIQLMWACSLAAGFLGFYPSTHLPTYERMDS